MKRLEHSFSGYLRLMQMSECQVFAFVEGKRTDPYFYSKICESVCRPVGVSYEIRRAQELTGGNGGKQVLVSFFEYLRRKSALIDRFKGKITGVVFFLDKDVDDFLRTKRRSDHVVYTLYYDVNNHIFVDGDLVEAAAASASMSHEEVLAGLGDCECWRRRVAERWKEWVTLCLFVAKTKIPIGCNYGATSRINDPPDGATDLTAYAEYLESLEERTWLSSARFERAFRLVSKLVDDLYRRGEHDRIFKGEWYTTLLAVEIRRIGGSRHINSSGLERRLPSNVALTLDFEQPWADHFKEPVRKLIGKLEAAGLATV